ncbi:hypothetical protein OAM67_00130 [bacterium]|nr:hypothetical protein [bacterium]
MSWDFSPVTNKINEIKTYLTDQWNNDERVTQQRRQSQLEQCQHQRQPQLIQELDVEELQKREDEQDAKELAQKTAQLHEIMLDITPLIEEQGEQLVHVDETVETAEQHTTDAVQEIEKGRQHFFASRVWKATGIAVVCGLAVGFPVGAGIAAAAGGTAVLGSGIAGSLLGSGIAGGSAYGITKSKV